MWARRGVSWALAGLLVCQCSGAIDQVQPASWTEPDDCTAESWALNVDWEGLRRDRADDNDRDWSGDDGDRWWRDDPWSKQRAPGRPSHCGRVEPDAGVAGPADAGPADVVPVAAAVLVAAAGDISPSIMTAQKGTSDLIVDAGYAAVLAVGDTQYEVGSLADFQAYFEPTWGRFKRLIYPVPGNHEYYTAWASGYYEYFGARAGDPTKGYYSFDLGAWHLVALNSNDGACTAVGCNASSEQVRWLAADLASSHQPCVLAYWHHPRFNSGTSHGDTLAVGALWETLYAASADIVLNGHEHIYERFDPQTPGGVADARRGLRQFTVGTGGRTLDSIGVPRPNSVVRQASTFGVLRLSLEPGAYGWEFVGVQPTSFSDIGRGTCHPK